MLVKNDKLIMIFNGMSSIREKKLPIKVGYAINKNLTALESCAKTYEEERKKILMEYCEIENGAPKIENDEYVLRDRKGYADDMTELLGIENEVNIQMVTFEDLEKCDNEKFDSLTPDELMIMEFMIEE